MFEYLKYYPFLQTILPAEKFSALETALKKTFIQVGSYITSNYTDKDTQVKL
ncbi:MAG: hypothetical protein Q8O99_07985 [bacterium]|nr:hypothetical protein [bacterium]